MNSATYLLSSKLREMCDCEGEMEFYFLEPLFTEDVDVSEIVKTFQVVYDAAFEFFGSATELYKKIEDWMNMNVG